MSRSTKKSPIIGICLCKAKVLSKAKRKMVRSTRQKLSLDENAPSGSYYKKYMHDWAWRPDDGRQRFENPKSFRK